MSACDTMRRVCAVAGAAAIAKPIAVAPTASHFLKRTILRTLPMLNSPHPLQPS